MATFKVGQRVRINHAGGVPRERPEGSVGTITELFVTTSANYRARYGEHHRVQVDGIPDPYNPNGWTVPVCFLSPLTDPGADAFIERIKKLKPYEEPKVPARNPEYSGRNVP